MIFQIDSPQILEAFKNDNYLVEYDDNAKLNTCVVYFSSNEIYYPNTSQAFAYSIIQRNKYEWRRNRFPGARKHIFVRDIKKQWYIDGINNEIDEPKKILEFLRIETKGFEVITIGSSAGGYAAILFGSLLKCKKIFAFNAQFNLNLIVENSTPNVNPVLFANKFNNDKSVYFDLSNYVYPSNNIYYFQSSASRFDIEQYNSLSNDAKSQIKIIRFKTSNHGFPFLRLNINQVLNLRTKDLERYIGNNFHPITFSIQLIGIQKTIKFVFQTIIKRLQKKYLEKIQHKKKINSVEIMNFKKYLYSNATRLFNLKKVKDNYSETILKSMLVSNNSVMIARFGANEIKAMIYPKLNWISKRILIRFMNYDREAQEFLNMRNVAGFFPADKKSILKFSKLMYNDVKNLDVLASWRVEEILLRKDLSTAIKIDFRVLEPYFNKNPWSEALENKKILVIHPFNKTIEYQYYNKRGLLFKDPRVLPKFKQLTTIKAVQSLGREETRFSDWFEALDFMKSQINECDFEIAIIGAGAYGFPLASHIKKLGKKAIHMGGATQILFGIKGRRWVENPDFNEIINEHFIFPREEDRVLNEKIVEGGCYWG
jgi:hypothetical protein